MRPIHFISTAVAVFTFSCCGGMPIDGNVGGGSGGNGGGGGSGGGGSGAVTITINYSGACAAVAGCTSSPLGTWHYVTACVEAADPYPSLKRICSGITFGSLTGNVNGRVTVGQSTVNRVITSHVTGTATVPATCAATVGGCSGVQSTLAQKLSQVSCTGTTSCTCTFTDDDVINTTVPSVFAGSALTTDPGTSDERTYRYCLNGGTLTYQESTANPDDTGVYGMAP